MGGLEWPLEEPGYCIAPDSMMWQCLGVQCKMEFTPEPRVSAPHSQSEEEDALLSTDTNRAVSGRYMYARLCPLTHSHSAKVILALLAWLGDTTLE
jgi:hypothetical protein